MKLFHIYLRALLLLCISVTLYACSGRDDNSHESIPAKDLSQLDNLINQSKEIDARKARAIDSLQSVLKHIPHSDSLKQMQTLRAIGNQYRSFCSDSSVIYYGRAQQIASRINPKTYGTDLRIDLINACAASGIFTIAEHTLLELDSASLSPTQTIAHAKAGRQLYSYYRGYMDDDNDITPMLTSRFTEYDSFLREKLPPDDPYRKFWTAEQHMREGRNKEARRELEAMLKNLSPTDNLYGMVAFGAAQASRNMGDDYNYGRYLALSAMSDVQGSVKETLAMPALAQWLYEKGEVDRAYKYINVSLNDATTSNSRMRTVAIANYVPIIDNSYRHKISASRDELMIYFLLVVVLLITSGTLLAIFLRNLRRSNQIRRKLRTQTKMQENYIGHFLGMCASYADKLEATRKLVQRKITAGQTDELLKMLKTSRTSEDQTDDFFKIFDETFLDLYPDFIDKFNTLLRPEEQISYTKGTPLTTELRIYAFVRLGVQESVRIAQILRCSVSTIYTYRNRMRGRAINRDTFEQQVSTLGEEKD